MQTSKLLCQHISYEHSSRKTVTTKHSPRYYLHCFDWERVDWAPVYVLPQQRTQWLH